MKTPRILITLLALCGTAAFAAETQSSSSSVTVNTGPDGRGKAVITIDINGKKETREIDLGNATRIEIRTDESNKNIKSARVTYLGAAMSELPGALADQLGIESGVVVSSVVPKSPAAEAGLQKNDVLVRLDAEPLKSPRQAEELVNARKEGEKVTLHYVRRAQPGSVEATLGTIERMEDLQQLTERLKPAAGEWLQDAIGKGFGIHRKAVVIGPDGKLIVQDDPAKQMREAAESVEKALRDAKVGEKTLDAVRDALADAVKALDKVRDPNAAPGEAAEIARKAGDEARARAEEIRREVDERVRRVLREKAPDASEVPLVEPKLEKK